MIPKRDRRGAETNPARVVAPMRENGLSLICTVRALTPESTGTSIRKSSIAG